MSSGPDVTTIVFDVMDTLLRDPFREALEAATGRPLRQVFDRRDPLAYPAFERGELDEAGYWAGYARAGIEVDPATFHRVRRAGTRWLPGMRALLEDLDGVLMRATGSNYPHWIDEVAREHLSGRVDQVIASCHLGARKPDPDFFERLLGRLGCAPEHTLFIDDRAANVEAARAVGLRAHRFTDADAARSWIGRQGVESLARPLGRSSEPRG